MIKESIEAWLYSPKEGQILLLQVQEDGAGQEVFQLLSALVINE